METLGLIRTGEHILGVFSRKTGIDVALKFLKEGFDKNEAVMLLTDYISKDAIRERIISEWNVDDTDILEAERHIILMTPQELLFPGGTFVANKKALVWKEWTDIALQNGKRGLRIYVDTSPMFKLQIEKKVIQFESTLPKEFEFPCTIVCAYTKEDIKGLGRDIYHELKQHHSAAYL